jgi:hypothetical protein
MGAVTKNRTSRVILETRYFPIVVVTIYEGWEARDLQAMFGEFEKLFQSSRRYALIVDTVRADRVPNAMERALLTDWDVANTAHTERVNVGSAIVFNSALVRGTLTAIGWVVKRNVPIVYLPTVGEAAVWSAGKLDEAGIALSSEALGYITVKGAPRP